MTTPTVPGSPWTTPADPRETRKRGCLFWCLVAAGLAAAALAVVVLVAVIAGVAIRHKINSTTDAQSVPVAIADPSPADMRRSHDELLKLATAMQGGRSETVAFTDRDLNNLIAGLAQCEKLRGRLSLTIVGDRLVADASLPLDDIPGLKGRYLNQSQIELSVRFADGRLDLVPQQITVKGKPLPGLFMSKLRQVNVGDRLREDANVRRFLDQVQSIEVRDGRLLIRTLGKP